MANQDVAFLDACSDLTGHHDAVAAQSAQLAAIASQQTDRGHAQLICFFYSTDHIAGIAGGRNTDEKIFRAT